MPTTPNHAPQSPNTAPSNEARAAYAIDVISDWRQTEHAELNQLRAAAVPDITNDQYVSDFLSGIEGRLDAYLQTKGIDQSDPEYQQIRDMYREAGIDKIGDHEWGDSPAGRGVDANDHESQCDKFAARITQWQTAHDTRSNSNDNPDTGKLTPDQWVAMKGEQEAWYSEISKKYAELAADRSGKLFERRKGKNRQEIDAAKDEAADMLNALATQMMDELESQGKSPDEIAEAIEQFVNSEADKLMGSMENYRIERYEKSGRALKWVYDKWAKWTDESTDKETGKKRFFSKGNFKKMLAMAGAAAPIAVGTGLALPAAGIVAGAGAFATATVATFAGFRAIGRNIAGGYLDRKSKQKRLATEQSEEIRAEYKKAMEADEKKQRATIFEVVDERSTIYRKRNRNRAIAGTAIAGTIGLVSATAADYVSGAIDGDWLAGQIDRLPWLGSHGGSGTVDLDGGGDIGGDASQWSDGFESNTPEVANPIVVVPTPETLVDQLNVDDSFTVESGHGYTHEIVDIAKANDIKIDGDDAWDIHQELVDKVGEDYLNLNDHKGADVYSMGESKYEVGISAPSHDATWDPQAQEILAERLNELQGGDASDVATSADVTTPGIDQMTDTQVIDSSGLDGLEQAADTSASQASADWPQMRNGVDNLISNLSNGDYDSIRGDADIQYFLNDAGQYDLKSIKYPGTDTLVFEHVMPSRGASYWAVNPIPSGSHVPIDAITVLENYQRSVYALAA